MMESLILAAPAGTTRERMVAFFEPRVARLHVLTREDAVSGQRLVIEDEVLRWDGQDILGAGAAVVLDSGFMWPVPRLAPDEATWNELRGRFDEFLRDESESASLWFSVLEILTDRLPRVWNPQPAFANAALKPAALDRLRGAGVPVLEQLQTNDPDAVRALAAAAPGALLSLPVGDQPGPSRWLEEANLAGLALDREPVWLQAPAGPSVRRVVAVDGVAVAVDGVAGAEGLESALKDALSITARELSVGFAEVIFRPGVQGWALSDFDPAPALGAWDPALAESVLEGLWRVVQEAAP